MIRQSLVFPNRSDVLDWKPICCSSFLSVPLPDCTWVAYVWGRPHWRGVTVRPVPHPPPQRTLHLFAFSLPVAPSLPPSLFSCVSLYVGLFVLRHEVFVPLFLGAAATTETVVISWDNQDGPRGLVDVLSALLTSRLGSPQFVFLHAFLNRRSSFGVPYTCTDAMLTTCNDLGNVVLCR